MPDSESSPNSVRLELQKMLVQIGETHNCMLLAIWLGTRHRRLDLGGGRKSRSPFEDGSKIVTPAFFHRLSDLKSLSGGWCYYDNGIAFYAREAWLKKRAEIVAECERMKQEEHLRLARIRRLSEIVFQARQDRDFWKNAKNHLREVLNNIQTLTDRAPRDRAGIVRIRNLTEDEVKAQNAKRIRDPILRAFCEKSILDADVVDYWSVQDHIISAVLLDLYEERKLPEGCAKRILRPLQIIVAIHTVAQRAVGMSDPTNSCNLKINPPSCCAAAVPSPAPAARSA